MFVRHIDFCALEKNGLEGQLDAQKLISMIENDTWKATFVIAYLTQAHTAEECVLQALCKWNRFLIPVADLFCCDADGVFVEPWTPLLPTTTDLCSKTSVFPPAFCVVTRPSSFVPPSVVSLAYATLNEATIERSGRKKREARKIQSRHHAALAALRKTNVREIEENQRHKATCAVLAAHKAEEARILKLKSSPVKS